MRYRVLKNMIENDISFDNFSNLNRFVGNYLAEIILVSKLLTQLSNNN